MGALLLARGGRAGKGRGRAHKELPRATVRLVFKLYAVIPAEPACRASSPSDAGAHDGLRLGGRLHGQREATSSPSPFLL